MSKIIDELLPEDFGRTFDLQVFETWKQKMREQAKVGFIVIILQVIGLVAIILLGGLVGLALLFTALITAMIISKRKAVKQYQDKLGITNAELKQALALRRGKVK